LQLKITADSPGVASTHCPALLLASNLQFICLPLK